MTARSRKTAVAAVTKPNFAALLDAASLPKKPVDICMRGDLLGEHEAAEGELARLKDLDGDSLAGNGAAEVAERIRAIEAEMQANTYRFWVRSLPKVQYRALVAEHPIRMGEDGEPDVGDQNFGFNRDTGIEPLLRACLVDPELDDAGYNQLLNVLNDVQFQELAFAAWVVNKGGTSIPFSSAASELTRSSTPE